MAGKLCDLGERLLLDTALVHVPALTLHLIKQAFTPMDVQLVSDLAEADYDGYAPQSLVYSGLEAGNPGGRAVADFAALTFLCTGSAHPCLIYGYWVENAAHDVLWLERFNGNARPMQIVGQTVYITPRLRLYSPT